MAEALQKENALSKLKADAAARRTSWRLQLDPEGAFSYGASSSNQGDMVPEPPGIYLANAHTTIGTLPHQNQADSMKVRDGSGTSFTIDTHLGDTVSGPKEHIYQVTGIPADLQSPPHSGKTL